MCDAHVELVARLGEDFSVRSRQTESFAPAAAITRFRYSGSRRCASMIGFVKSCCEGRSPLSEAVRLLGDSGGRCFASFRGGNFIVMLGRVKAKNILTLS